MTLSTLSAGAIASTEPDVLAEDSEPAEGKPSRGVIVLSAQAKERLRLLNRVLENCVPNSLSARDSLSSDTP